MSDHPTADSTAAAAAAAAADVSAEEALTSPVSDTASTASESKGMMEYFRKRYQSGGVGAGNSNAAVCGPSEPLPMDVHTHYGHYHTVSSSDARVLKAALAKERVPVFRPSESKTRRSTAGMRFAYPKDRAAESKVSETDQPFGSVRSESRSFRDIFMRRRNRSDRSEPSQDIAADVKPKVGGVRMRNLLVSFRSRPGRAVSVSYSPVDASSSSTSAAVPAGSPAASVQTVGKRKKFRVTPATLLPGLKRPEPPRVGPEDFVEMYCRSRTTSDPRADAILKARVAANLHKVSTGT